MSTNNPQVLERPAFEALLSETSSGWIVRVFNNDVNTEEEVIAILMVATRCTLQEAEMETWEVHFLGSSVVHHGPETDCREVAAIISQIGIRVEVSAD